jgi:MscS family membrane protein
MRSTKIRTLDNYLTIVPNSVIANAEVVNVSAGYRRRIWETFGVTYDTSDEKLKRAIEILEDILSNTPEISKDFVVFLDTLDSSSINIKVHAYVKTKVWSKYLKEKEKFILEAVRRFRAEGIDFAFPSQTIYMAKDSNEN